MNGEVRPPELVLGIEPDADRRLERAVDREPPGEREHDARAGADHLGRETDPAHAAQRRLAENAAGDPAPGPAQAVERPDAEHVVDLETVLGEREGPHEQRARDRAGDQRADRVHDVGPRAHRDQAGERAVMNEARIVASGNQRGDDAARHRHQRIHGDQPGNIGDFLRAHDVEPEPADAQHPGAEGEERDVRRRDSDHGTVGAVAALARAQQQHGAERDPAADRVHHDRPGEIVKRLAERRLHPVLEAEPRAPHHSLERGVNQSDDDGGRRGLRPEPRALGDAAGNDRRHRRGEGEQEEKFDQVVARRTELVAVAGDLPGQHLGAGEEIDAVGDRVADEEIGERRNREIAQDLDERVDLASAPHGADFEKREAGVHGEHHRRAHEQKQYVGTRFKLVHGRPPSIESPQIRGRRLQAPCQADEIKKQNKINKLKNITTQKQKFQGMALIKNRALGSRRPNKSSIRRKPRAGGIAPSGPGAGVGVGSAARGDRPRSTP